MIFSRLTACIALGGMLVCSNLYASVISFDPTGTATYQDLASFDINPGSLVNRATAVTDYDNGGVIQAYYQALITAFDTGSSINSLLPTTVGVDPEFTVVLGFQQSFTNIGPSILSSFVPGGNNYFGLYYDAVSDANNLAGTGFADGSLIMEGTVIGVSAVVVQIPGTTTFDQFAGDSYAGLQSIQVTGGFQLTIAISDYDSNFFGSPPGTIIHLALPFGDIQLPFNKVDPSRLLNSSLDGSTSFAPNLGAVNGTGLDRQFQVDATASFEFVPEPASMLVWGGLASALGLGGLIRRRKK